jgi:DNA-binding beta-propeller fold protein YncE
MAADALSPFALTNGHARADFLKAVCVIAEAAAVDATDGVKKPQCDELRGDTPSCVAAKTCVEAILYDALRRVTTLGGREGMPRSLGSVYGGLVALFLGSTFQGKVQREIPTPDIRSWCNGLAITRDGSTLLSAYFYGHTVHVYNAHTGKLLSVVGSQGTGPLQFLHPSSIHIARDDFVLVAETDNHRIQVLTPRFEFHAFVGVGQLHGPVCVCCDEDSVYVSEWYEHRVSVFSRSTGALLRRIGSRGSGDGQLCRPVGLCILSSNRHIAVAERENHRVSVFNIDGAFIRHVGVGEVNSPAGIACSAFDELVVVDVYNRRIVVYDACGKLAKSFGDWFEFFSGVALHGDVLLTQTARGIQVFT